MPVFGLPATDYKLLRLIHLNLKVRRSVEIKKYDEFLSVDNLVIDKE